MRIDVRTAARLRGHDPINLMSALAPVVGALSSFADTLPLLHPFGRLICHDLFVTDVRDYKVATRIQRALRFVAPEKLSVDPDCGLRHLPPQAARAKLKVMVAGAAEVRAELGSAAT